MAMRSVRGVERRRQVRRLLFVDDVENRIRDAKHRRRAHPADV